MTSAAASPGKTIFLSLPDDIPLESLGTSESTKNKNKMSKSDNTNDGNSFELVCSDDAKSFAIEIGNRKLLQHSASSPCLWLGDGQIKFTEHEGHFQIEDIDANRRWPLSPTASSISVVTKAKKKEKFQVNFHSSNVTSGDNNVSGVCMTVSKEMHELRTVDGEFRSTTTPITKIVIKLDSKLPENTETPPSSTHLVEEKPNYVSHGGEAKSAEFQRVWLRLPFDQDEHFYGAGEQFTHFDLRGHKFPIWTREQGVGRDSKHPLWTAAEQFGKGYGGDYHTTYFPQLSFVSSGGVYFFDCGNSGVYVENSYHQSNRPSGTFYSELDFSSYKISTTNADDFSKRPSATDGSYVEVMLYGRMPFECAFLLADSCTQAVQAFTSMFGAPLRIPNWVHEGAILGLQGGTDVAEDVVLKLLDVGGVVRGLWIQDWVGKFNTSFGQRLFWNWVWDPVRYPQLLALVQRLLRNGIRTLGYASPHVRREASLYQEAAKRNFLVLATNSDGKHPLIQDFGEFHCGTIDLTNTAACNWFRDTLRQNMLEAVGFSGWMADFSEYIPAHASFANGMTGIEAHNSFPVMWAKLNHDIVAGSDRGKDGFDEYLYWMRAGGLGSQRYVQMLWAGDQCQSFEPKADGLASVIPAFLSAGVSGLGVNHFDIGMFTGFSAPPGSGIDLCLRTKELLLRSAEMAVFTPVFRTHEGNRPRLSHQFYSDDDTLRTFALYTQAHAVLAPYHKHLVSERRARYLPVFRPMVFFLEKSYQKSGSPLKHDVEEACRTVQNQYGYGDLLLVAPVVEENTSRRRVLLPPLPNEKDSGVRQWQHLTTAKRYDGGQWVDVSAKLGEPPVFVDIDNESAKQFLNVFEKLGAVFRLINERFKNCA